MRVQCVCLKKSNFKIELFITDNGNSTMSTSMHFNRNLLAKFIFLGSFVNSTPSPYNCCISVLWLFPSKSNSIKNDFEKQIESKKTKPKRNKYWREKFAAGRIIRMFISYIHLYTCISASHCTCMRSHETKSGNRKKKLHTFTHLQQTVSKQLKSIFLFDSFRFS